MTAAPGAVRETAYAKINLALHVRERMADGYHRLETLFAFAEDGDVLECAPADDLTLEIDGPFAAGLPTDTDNLVMKAARALRDRVGTDAGARLSLAKNLPVASGIGGGSADAAATLRGLASLWDVAESSEVLADIAAELGADVPACLLSRTCFGSGRGDALQPVEAPDLRGRPVLLVNAGKPVSTPAVFAGWDGHDRGGLALGEQPSPSFDWRNDLTAPAIAIEGAIAEVLDALEALTGADLVRMSGSGATCFALFSETAQCEHAAAQLRDAQPDWWVWTSSLR